MTTSSSQFLSLRIGSNDAFPTTASFNYNLAPEHEWLPFEPFSSIIREIGSSSNLQLLIDNLKAPARIRTIFLNWLCSSDYKEPEPAHPDQYIFEQSVIPKTLITLLNSILQERSLTVTISNAQFLSNSACRLIEGLSDHKQANIQLVLWTPLDAFKSEPVTAALFRVRRPSLISICMLEPSRVLTSCSPAIFLASNEPATI